MANKPPEGAEIINEADRRGIARVARPKPLQGILARLVGGWVGSQVAIEVTQFSPNKINPEIIVVLRGATGDKLHMVMSKEHGRALIAELQKVVET